MKHRSFICQATLLTILILACAGPLFSEGPRVIEPVARPVPGVIEIGDQKQLFLDDRILDQTHRISRLMGRPQKYAGNPVLKADQPWELVQSDIGMQGLQITGQNVLYDEEEKIFKMWYWATAVNAKVRLTQRRWGYAVSRDGYNWEKPRLNLHEFEGNRANNLVSSHEWAGGGYHNIFKDPHDADPNRRYKAMGTLGANRPAGQGLAVGFSPDGVRWTEYTGNPVVPLGPELADTPTFLGWDPRIRKYVYYPRPGPPQALTLHGGGGGNMRTVGYSESDDFVNWTPNRIMIAPDGHDRVDFQYYQLTTAIYGDFYVGLLAMYETHAKTFDVYLLSSRDGFNWNWVDRHRPFLGRGEIGTYDAGYLTPSGPIFHDGKVWIFYGAYSGAHSWNIGPLGQNRFTIALATLPMDRFLGLLAGPNLATIITRPLAFAGNKLLLDIDASIPYMSREALLARDIDPNTRGNDHAEIRAALEDPMGRTIEGFALEQCTPLTGSGVQEMTWPGADWSQISGKSVRVRLEMRNAALYSLQFAR